MSGFVPDDRIFLDLESRQEPKMKSAIVLASAFSLLLLTACGADPSSADSATTTASSTSRTSTTKSKTEFAPLKDNETIQGVLEADIGKGLVPFRSLATRISDDLGAEADRKLATTQGREKLAQANASTEGTGVSLSASDISELAHSMAGKTISNSTVAGVRTPPMLVVTLRGQSAHGDELTVVITYDANTLQLRPGDHGNVSFTPAGGGWRDIHESRQVSLAIEHFERNADGSYAIKGRFSADNLEADEGVKIEGPSAIEGHFDFQSLPYMQI